MNLNAAANEVVASLARKDSHCSAFETSNIFLRVTRSKFLLDFFINTFHFRRVQDKEPRTNFEEFPIGIFENYIAI